MKRMLSLLLVALLLVPVAALSETQRLNWHQDYVDRFDITARYYLPMVGLDWVIESEEYNDYGFLKRTKFTAEYKDGELAFIADDSEETIEYTSNIADLNLAFAKALVVSVNGNYDLVDLINTLPQTGVPYSRNETIYACALSVGPTVRYSVVETSRNEYLHSITLLH